MAMIFDYVDPAVLTGYVRQRLAELDENQFRLSRFLPNKEIQDLDYEFNRGGQGLIRAAQFRTFNTESPIGTRRSAVKVKGSLPPISQKLPISEHEILKLRGLDNEIKEQIYNDADELVMSLAARMEWARGEALASGKVVLSENGVTATVDFGRAGGHTVNAGTAWTDTSTSTPLDDLASWSETYENSTGSRPGVALISRARMSKVLQNDQLGTQVGSVLRLTPTRLTRSQVNEVFAEHDLPQLEVFEEKILHPVTGATQRVIDEDEIVLLPADGTEAARQLGATLYGVTAEALKLQDRLSAGDVSLPGISAWQYVEEDAVTEWTKASAIALPVLANPDLSFKATI